MDSGMSAAGWHGNQSFGDAFEKGEIATPASLPELENHGSQSQQSKSSEYHYADSEVSIWVSAGKNALPDGAKFVVTPVTENSTDFNYDAYLAAYQQSFRDGTDIDDAAKTDDNKTFFYDMRFLADEINEDGEPTGKKIEVEPAEGTVTVTVTLTKKADKQEGVELEDDIHPGNSSAQTSEALSVTHLPLKSEVKSKNGGLTAGAKITAQDILVQPMEDKIISQAETSVKFKADEFSVFVFRVMPTEINAAQQTPSSNSTILTPQSVLGQAMNYGIVANEFYLKQGDAETNVAAKVGTCVHQTGNGEKTIGQKQTFMIGRVDGDNQFQIKGKQNTTIICPEDQKDRFKNLDNVKFTFTHKKEDEIKSMIDSMIAFASKQITIYGVTYKELEYRQKYYLDLSNEPDATYYVNLIVEHPGPYQHQPMGQDEMLNISKNPNQAVVLVDFSNKVNLQKFTVNGEGSDSLTGKDGYAEAKGIFFYLPNAETVNIDGSVVGTILAPKATVNVNRTSAGHLVANIVNIKDGEWHNIDQEEPQPTGSESEASSEKQEEPQPIGSESEASGKAQEGPQPSGSESESSGEKQEEPQSSGSESEASGEKQEEPQSSGSESESSSEKQEEPQPSGSESSSEATSESASTTTAKEEIPSEPTTTVPTTGSSHNSHGGHDHSHRNSSEGAKTVSQAYDEGAAVESSGGIENIESGAANVIERPFLANGNTQESKTTVRRIVSTGDDSRVWLYASICAISAGLLVVFAFLRKKYQK